MANLAQQRLARATAAMCGDPVLPPGEPRLREIIDDPVTHRLMASDGIEHDHLIRLMNEARTKLARRRA
jgi:hypothetical protein